MVKKFLLLSILLVFTVVPVLAGVYEDAISSGRGTFLYLYTPECGYCKKFNPIYQKLANTHKNKCTFLKIDASTPYGPSIIRRFRAYYVPYVVVSKKSTFVNIEADCLMDYVCTEKVLNKVVNN